jgi:hypothetical protein
MQRAHWTIDFSLLLSSNYIHSGVVHCSENLSEEHVIARDRSQVR